MAALALLSLAPAAAACINTVGTDYTGRKFHPNWYIGTELTSSMRPYKVGPDDIWVKHTIERALKSPGFDTLNDLGVVLIRQGKYSRAIEHFLTVERLFPGHAQTAANLGTVLELSGHDRVALRWIRIGMKRDPNEHYRTEWLHARILEAKAEMATDPNYLKGRSIAGVSFSDDVVPPLPTKLPAGNDGRPVALWQLNFALSYQLSERTTFVAAPDPVVANLLMDWATLNLAGGPVENAAALYDLAVRYGAPRDALMDRRQAHVREVLAKADKEPKPADIACGICEPPPEAPPAPPKR
ncbi:hypothetical protein J5226_07020 [Lysobacter sp. K5869]|uniref:tetratricopeptide repeat protein n=1 Tax=Lysobacter sp. K5869 TaxID=2820808 RepID=UPI001C05FB3D|nr:hypothetical protein [Lysobacter sp. K5869]QWP78141.1 hypothetical protein J5226_07020 [Lysobacter sp. K5869]